MADDFQIYSNIKSKDINYLSRDFDSFKQNLIQYTKSYFPGTYTDFSENSTGMMFIELASYVGDVLSYYVDYQFKEGFLQYASERKNILALANYLGYKPKPAKPSSTMIDIMQLVPSRLDGDGKNIPDMRYALNIQSGVEIRSADDPDVIFRTTNSIQFAENNVSSPLEISVFERDSGGQPTFYLLKKSAHVTSGTLIKKNVSVGDAQEFFEIELPETNVLEIVSVKDTTGAVWHEVPYMAQDLVLIEEQNTQKNNPLFYKYATTVPYILRYIKTSKRYITHTNSDNSVTIEFGKGADKLDEEIITPSMNNVGRNTNITKSTLDMSYDPSNFLKSDSYGESPSNTTLNVEYYIGGGDESNVKSNVLTRITSVSYADSNEYLSASEQLVLESVKNSLMVNNPNPARGGRGAEDDEEIRMRGLSNLSSQMRAVTKEDYVIRAYAMPSKYGSVAKAFVTKDGILDTKSQIDLVKSSTMSDTDVQPNGLNTVYGEINNPFAVNMYILSYDETKKLTAPNELVLHNLTTYMTQFRMLTDGINITNAFIINVGVYFEISVFQNFNKKEVLLNCINKVTEYFDIGKWQISQPIEIGNVELLVSQIKGVKSVSNLEFVNLTINDGDYSENEYDIGGATINKIIYPSMDPSIFEVKFPSRDIVGRVI